MKLNFRQDTWSVCGGTAVPEVGTCVFPFVAKRGTYRRPEGIESDREGDGFTGSTGDRTCTLGSPGRPTHSVCAQVRLISTPSAKVLWTPRRVCEPEATGVVGPHKQRGPTRPPSSLVAGPAVVSRPVGRTCAGVSARRVRVVGFGVPSPGSGRPIVPVPDGVISPTSPFPSPNPESGLRGVG